MRELGEAAFECEGGNWQEAKQILEKYKEENGANGNFEKILEIIKDYLG